MWEGWLRKRGEIHKSWKRRWFEVRDGHAFYYKAEGETRPLGAIPLTKGGSITVSCSDDADDYFSPVGFLISSPKRTWVLEADNELARRACIEDIRIQLGEIEPPAPRTLSLSYHTTESSVLTKAASQRDLVPSADPSMAVEVSSLREQLDNAAAQLEELQKRAMEDKQVIHMLRSQVETLGKENVGYVRLMQSADKLEDTPEGSNDVDHLRNELKKTKTTLVAQLSQVAFLNAEIRRTEQENGKLQELLDEIGRVSHSDDMRRRYNYIERKLAILCSKVSPVCRLPIQRNSLQAV